MEAPTILANTDYTDEFHRKCVWRSPGVLFKVSDIPTEKYVWQFLDRTITTLVHVDKKIIFLN